MKNERLVLIDEMYNFAKLTYYFMRNFLIKEDKYMVLFIVLMSVLVVAALIAFCVFAVVGGIFALATGEIWTCGFLFHKLFELFKK